MLTEKPRWNLTRSHLTLQGRKVELTTLTHWEGFKRVTGKTEIYFEDREIPGLMIFVGYADALGEAPRKLGELAYPLCAAVSRHREVAKSEDCPIGYSESVGTVEE